MVHGLDCLLAHISDSKVPDFIVCKESVSCDDHSEASSSVVKVIQVIIPVLFTFGLFVGRAGNYYDNCEYLAYSIIVLVECWGTRVL